jgi:hypothetical protein
MAVHLVCMQTSAPRSAACCCRFLCKAPTHPVVGIPMQVSDGAAASLLMTRREAQRRGLPILGIWRGFSAVGVPPEIMGEAHLASVCYLPTCLKLACCTCTGRQWTRILHQGLLMPVHGGRAQAMLSLGLHCACAKHAQR